jgi:uncharacterized membrane protein
MPPPLATNPLAEPQPAATRSSVSLYTHPLHPMMVNFPIAYLLGALGSDLAFWWTADPFWARASLWLIGAGLAIGVAAALAGALDFLLVKEIRRFTASWSHFLMGVVLLGIAAANWWMRLADAEGSVLPWGVFLSTVSAAAVTVTGWLGAKLVFDHNVGTAEE